MTNRELIFTVISAALASSGMWAFISKFFENKSAKSKMLVGLAHDRIISLGMTYIERGWITNDEYENLNDYLYLPYEKMGGNGSAKRIMCEVQKLPIRSNNKEE